LRALQMDYDGADSTALLERAARVNPVSSSPRIRLGLAAESRGDYSGAEKWLLEAARVDHQFEPRWTLANFYFRSQRPNEFWKWIRAALEFSYGDRRLAFELCWRMTQDAGEILTRAIPNQHDVVATYLIFTMNQHHEAVGAAALRLAEMRDPTDRPLLEGACDLLLNSGKLGNARELWGQLGHLQTGLITNSNFTAELSGHGFDWRPAHSPGVTDLQVPGAHRILFSGTQSESCELLRQYVVLEPGKWYSLRWEARTQGLDSTTGVQWSVGTARGAIDAAQDWRPGGLEFKAGASLIPIVFGYQRPVGQSRVQGSVEIRNVSLVEK
jgi:hypothetical protein